MKLTEYTTDWLKQHGARLGELARSGDVAAYHVVGLWKAARENPDDDRQAALFEGAVSLYRVMRPRGGA